MMDTYLGVVALVLVTALAATLLALLVLLVRALWTGWHE